MEKNILIFDVESTSLHGLPFAVGGAVFSPEKTMVDQFCLVADRQARYSNEWVKNNVLPALSGIERCEHVRELRDRFFNWYIKHRINCTVWVDVGFPVETNFLSLVAKDDESGGRDFIMPYPLYDVACFVPEHIDRHIATMLNLVKHNPLDDAIASYHTLVASDNFKRFKNNLR